MTTEAERKLMDVNSKQADTIHSQQELIAMLSDKVSRKPAKKTAEKKAPVEDDQEVLGDPNDGEGSTKYNCVECGVATSRDGLKTLYVNGVYNYLCECGITNHVQRQSDLSLKTFDSDPRKK